MSHRPRILIFTGEGKGKTTSAFGMALRAAGSGMRVWVVQFAKSNPSGEVRAAAKLPGIEIVQAGLGFLPPADSQHFPRHQAAAQAGLRQAGEAIACGRFDMVVLDEVCVAVDRGLIEERQVIEVLRQARAGTVVVLTGRGATEGLIEQADTVTEMRCVKHAQTAGWPAQKGVEI